MLGLWMLQLGAVSPAKIHGNPANDLVALVNANRTASKLPRLRTSAGLGCMALQYISECIGGDACAGDNTVACRPPEAHITEVYAANCGVELPTVDVITGRLVGCHRQRSDAESALEAVLSSGNGNGNSTTATALAVIRGKEHTQVGAGFDRAHRHGPFFWCLLFSSGSANSTFLLEAAGKGVHQTQGCFSAPGNLSCDAANANAVVHLLLLLLLALASIVL
uniref:SCP domain-containing protein n=2 Tax=Oryza brachyantha TaxID=4533 RepID=J3LIT4_ORYBR